MYAEVLPGLTAPGGQQALPGLPRPPEPDPKQTPLAIVLPIHPGQMRFDHDQLVLQPAPAAPVQLELLDPPEPWETDAPAPATPPAGRLRRRRRRLGISPGQARLF